jgi:hypothetical protein
MKRLDRDLRRESVVQAPVARVDSEIADPGPAGIRAGRGIPVAVGVDLKGQVDVARIPEARVLVVDQRAAVLRDEAPRAVVLKEEVRAVPVNAAQGRVDRGVTVVQGPMAPRITSDSWNTPWNLMRTRMAS